jgi:hypothetical protein
MKNHWIAFYLIVLFSVPEAAFSQDLPDVIPPSPEAASFGKFSEVPVSHFTGVPNISVPITTVSVGEKTIPISIDYHARGIQVHEIASRVGMGWTLRAGGAVIRKTMSRPDDSSVDGFIGNYLTNALANQTFFTNSQTRANLVNTNASNNGGSSGNPDIDWFPDKYTIQAPGLSASFILDYNDWNSPLIQKKQNLKIQYGPLGNEAFGAQFIITDSEGYNYYFGKSKDGSRSAGDFEQVLGNFTFPQQGSYSSTVPNMVEDLINAWKLMDIESPDGELLSFYYNSETTQFYRRSYDDQIQDPVYGNTLASFVSHVQSTQYQLEKIVHSGGEILFDRIFSSERQDLNGGYPLDKIIIKDINDNDIKTFDLFQSYRTALIDNNINSNLKVLEPEAAKRLFLDSIVEVGSSNGTKPPFKFQYNSQQIPHRFSNSQDYWGMYNAASNGEYLTFFDYGITAVNRAVDTVKSSAGILEKITYPTGGYSKFQYEHNKGLLGPEYQNVVIPNVNPIEAKAVGLGSLQFQLPEYYNGSVYSVDFTIDGLVGTPTFSIWFQDPSNCNSNYFVNGCDFRVYIYGNNNIYELFMGNGIFPALTNGSYTLVVEPQSPGHNPMTNPNDHFGVNISWEEAVGTSNILYASGKRIKRIENYTGENFLSSYKEYDYTSYDNNSTSGHILGLSMFHSLSPSQIPGVQTLEFKGAMPGGPFSTYQGNTIGYSRVIEYFGDHNNNHGKTEYRFTTYRDTGDYVSYPYHPPTDNEWLRGMPLEILYYKRKSDNTYSIVKDVENRYTYAGNTAPLIFQPKPARKLLSQNLSVYQNPNLETEGLPYLNSDTAFRLPLVQLFFVRSLYDSRG